MSTDIMSVPIGTSNSDDLSDPQTASEIELRELVYQALERDGLINHLKAQLRAAVFKKIEESTNSQGINDVVSANETMNTRICRALVLDWLRHSHLLYTEDVFKVETAGPKHAPPLPFDELLEQLHIQSHTEQSQPLLHTLLDHNRTNSSSNINSLPDYIKKSINNHFPTEKINDLNRLREHFRSLYSTSFDPTVLDAFINKNISSLTSSLSKYDYEQICLKWMQACANVLQSKSVPEKLQSSAEILVQITAPFQPVNNTLTTVQKIREATKIVDDPSTGSSPSSSPTTSDDNRKMVFDFKLPTTLNSNKATNRKINDIIPPELIDFSKSEGNDDNSDDHDEDTSASASIFSKRNATPAALDRLKNIDDIIQGDETPRTRTNPQNVFKSGAKNIPIEYEDESISHSVTHSIISSVDDVTVDKDSNSPPANIDYIEMLDT